MKQTQKSNASSSSKDGKKANAFSSSTGAIPPPDVSLFGRRKYVSVRGLAAVLDEIKQYGVPEVTSRSSIKRARDTEFEAVTQTRYGKVIRSLHIGVDNKSEEALEFWFADPRATLYHFIRDCINLQSFVLECLDKHPCSMNDPWTIILYNDEVVAGNPLLRHNHRKAHAHYYSFLEFGPHALSSEFLWFTICIAKSDTVSSMAGGGGAGVLLKEVFQHFKVFETEGFVCGQVIIWAKVKQLISDEAALKVGIDVKGASGHMSCLKCRNVLKLKPYAIAEKKPNHGFVPISELDVTLFDPHDDTTLIANAKYVHEQSSVLTKTEFEKLQTALGITHNPNGVLLCESLEFKLSSVAFDYQHVFFVNGVFNLEVGRLLDMMKKGKGDQKVTCAQINTFFQDGWVWPFHQRLGQHVFESRSSDGGNLSCSASECLGCFALLMTFLCMRVFDRARDPVKAACCSYYALCRVVVLLTMTTRGSVTEDALMDAMQQHLKLHQSAYGYCHWKPKMHWCLHLPAQLRLYGFLVACFTHERKHKEIKRYMQGRMNPNLSFERNVLQDVLHIQQEVLNEDLPYPKGTCLIGSKVAPPNIASWVQSECQSLSTVYTAKSAKASNHTTLHVHDVVCVRWDNGDMNVSFVNTNGSFLVAQVLVLCSIGQLVLAGIRCWPKTPQHNMYSTAGPVCLVHLHDIIDVCIYKVDDNTAVAYVVPPRAVSV